MNKPEVKKGDLIIIGEKIKPYLYGVACNINENSTLFDIEVVYLQNNHKYVKDELVWDNNLWQFKNEFGGIVINESNECVQLLKSKIKK